ncbi:hypothetical protein BBJ29_005022 [Phytophthora kernoviae]|uniref:RING-type domain-containing protein n=3 Tax=Phytophthora kernoviae TaxID=325452 RepID=A0A3F2RUV8_9STRA|nr:hypothetical protein BBJ29_005022 [Phytophthora kernoviae]RLN64701.1 hypothetical protein BBP00_00003303 [Phytophthora kernoviae]
MTARVRRWSDVEARRRPLHRAAYANSTPSPAPIAPASTDVTPAAKSVPLAVMEDAPECVICLDELELGRALFTAECGHRFHFSCLLENVNHDEANSDKCPICRKPQTQWPEQTEGLVQIAGNEAQEDNFVTDVDSRWHIHLRLKNGLELPQRRLLQELRMPPSTGNSQQGMRQSFTGGGNSMNSGPRPIMRQCPTCYTRVQMPPGSQAGQYMCPHGHTFYFSPFQ